MTIRRSNSWHVTYSGRWCRNDVRIRVDRLNVFHGRTKISAVRRYATGTLRKGCPVTRRLHLYELWRKEPLYNPRWPPPRRGLLLANTRQEAPPWLTARDGMIYWDFCLFAPALQRTYRVPSF